MASIRPVFFEVSTYPLPTGTSIFSATTFGLPRSVCQSFAASLEKSVRIIASVYWVFPEGKGYLAKIGERITLATSVLASSTAFLPAASMGASMVSVIGTSTVGIVVVPPFAGSPPITV